MRQVTGAIAADGVRYAAAMTRCRGYGYDARAWHGVAGPRMQPHKEGAVRFKAYALKEKLGLAAGATRAQVLSAMKGKVLGKSNLLGKVGKGGSSKKKKAKQGKKKKKKKAKVRLALWKTAAA